MRVCSGIPGINLSPIALSSVDFPEPFFPTSEYLWPAFSLSLAFDKTSVPSDLVALALPFPPGVLTLGAAAEATVMLSPSMSS